MSKDSIFKKLHDLAMTDDGETSKSTAPPCIHIPAPCGSAFPAPASTGFGSFAGVATAPVLDESVYQRVLDKTNFDSTAAAATIHKYLDAMEGEPLDNNAKFKMALRQAAKLEGLTADKILAAFDQLKSALKVETDKFNQQAAATTAREVTARQTKLQQIADSITQKQNEIADLQQQHTQIAAELADAQTKVSNATTQFGLATQRRAQEIDQQQTQFAALLK